MVVGLEHVVVERWTGSGYEAIGRTASGCATPRTHELHLGTRRVGRLQLDAREVRRSHLALLEAVARCWRAGRRAARAPEHGAPCPTKVPPAGLEVAKESWGLTRRQVEALELVVRGLANKEISAVLGCTPGTVDHHVRALLRKAGLDSRAALVAAFWGQVVLGQ
ncbi:MAG: helix-turn-helix transcriptional regulator [Myxococcales bacterium]|nr:helix-turn-helix transcriptional regulator [Myxococcales bacterium]